MSGITSATSQANIGPVRPKPVKISSAIISMPWRVAVSRMRARQRSSWNTMPPAPCTSGSTSMPAISLRVLGDEAVEGRGAVVVARQIDDVMLGQHAGEERMHALFGIADAHGGDGVAVIAALEGDEFRAAALRPG